MQGKNSERLIFALLLLVPVTYIALSIAPYTDEGLVSAIGKGSVFSGGIRLCERSLRTVVLFWLMYAAAAAAVFSSGDNYRRRAEYGSASWGDVRSVSARLSSKNGRDNLILSQNLRLSLNTRDHGRNLNVLIVGGSGAGKTRSYAKPNLMQGNSSFVILDPKGELIRDTGALLETLGYEIKVLDLINMDRSLCYNPFMYLEAETEDKTGQRIQELATNLIRSTTPEGARPSDPFWETASAMLLKALIFYLHEKAPEHEQNFAMVCDLLRKADIKDQNDAMNSPLDRMFERLRTEDPDAIACKYYESFRKSAGNTAKSIIITLASHLEKFNLDAVAKLTCTDELELREMGKRKCALFAIIPDSDDSFNFIIGMLYTQLFQQLEYSADFEYGGRLPVPVHFIMDEFANVAVPQGFDKKISTMRSRGISVSIILQNISQLKKLFEKEWESIIGNCDEFVYLGGNEQSTHEYVSKLLGKETIDYQTHSKSTGRNGNTNNTFSITGRELLMPDEVRRLDPSKSIVFIRGEKPLTDSKFSLATHPYVRYTADGGAPPYDARGEDSSVCGIAVDKALLDRISDIRSGGSGDIRIESATTINAAAARSGGGKDGKTGNGNSSTDKKAASQCGNGRKERNQLSGEIPPQSRAEGVRQEHRG